MTVALAYVDKSGGCHMLSDSCASDAINHSVVRNPKVFNPVGRRDVLIGCAGTFRLPNLLKYIPGVFPGENELATEDIDMSYLVNEFSPVVKALTEGFEKLLLSANMLSIANSTIRPCPTSRGKPAPYANG